MLRALPFEEYTHLADALEPVTLELRHTIFSPGKPIEYLYFPVDSVFSLLATVDGGSAIEVATIGFEGVAGLPAFLGVAESPNDCFCQVPGRALRLATATMRNFLNGDGTLHNILHRYTNATMV
ncbi:MAG: Crp/Fnr family transcriptional regulator, partial [Actinobacteria bacterium]|nr:Crp/Fnr family transcriptional regulator [Actinomycetota bacterium]